MHTSSEFRKPRRAVAILAALAISTGAVACGSGDDDGGGGASGGASAGEREPLGKEAYLRQVNAAQSRFAAGAAKLDLANPSSPRQFGNSLGRLKGLVDTLRGRLAAIPAPEDVASEQDELVEQLRAYGAVIGQETDALRSGDPRRERAAARKVGRASTRFSQEFDATIRKINDDLDVETSPGG